MIKHVWDVKLGMDKAKVYTVPGVLIFNNVAMVVGQNTILLNKGVYKARQYDQNPERASKLMAHELEHCRQFRLHSWFIVRYLWESALELLTLGRPYLDNRFEVQARQAESLHFLVEILPRK